MEYQFKPLGKKCAGTGADLEPGSVCHSVLVEQDGDFVRLDFSAEGWTGPPAGTVGTWKSMVPKPAEVKRPPLDTNTLMSHFEQLCEEADPSREALRYVLALLLHKKRRLRLDGSRPAGGLDYLQFSGVQGNGAYEVVDLQPTDADLEEMQRALNEYLASEWGELQTSSAYSLADDSDPPADADPTTDGLEPGSLHG